MKVVSRNELAETIKKITGSTIVNFVAETEVRMNKTGNPYLGATKVAHVQGSLGWNYENVVNNQLGREDKELDFVAQPQKGKLHTDNKHFLTDEKTRTKTYLVVFPLPKSEEKREEKPTMYYFNGQVIDVELLKPFMVKSYTPQSQGTDKAIIYRTYEFKNIRSMKIKVLDADYVVGITQAQEKVAVESELVTL